MGIPWWAAVLGAPLVGEKVLGGISSVVDSLNRVNDVSQQRTDLKNYQTTGAMPDPTKYRDVETGIKTLDMFQKKAAPNAINSFRTEYEKQTGTTDPRFFGDAGSRAELAKVMSIPEPGKNPYVDTDINAFRKEGEQGQTLKAAAEGDPLAAARIGADKDLASSAHLAAQAVDIPLKRRQAQEKEDREQQKQDATETKTAQAQTDQSEFDRMTAGIGGRYQDAQPIVDGVTPTGPNVQNGLDYSDVQGKPTSPRIMPYDEARKLLLQAKSDYPLAKTDKAFSDLNTLYDTEHTSATRTPTATNWKGNVTKDMTQLQYAATVGNDPMAQRLIAAMDQRERLNSKAKAEDRRLTIVQNPLPSKVNVNELSAEQNAALTQAIAERRLDPYKVNSRNQQLLAQTALNNPGIDLNNIAAELGVARNKDVIMKSGIAEMIPDLLAETVKAGKSLKYSDVQFQGKAQKWIKGQLNDPKLVEYMTLRNDQLLTLGGVMRSNGMTDMAQRLEEEAARPTMSPRALEGWLNGQLKSIDPRLSLYRKLTKGNTAIPRSTYNPGDGTQKLLSGAPVHPSGVMKFDSNGRRIQ